MDVVLWILASIGLIVLLVVVIGLGSVAWMIVKARRSLTAAVGRLSRPATLTMLPEPTPAWTAAPSAKLARDLAAAGFRRVGTFTAEELPTLILDGWLRDDGLQAAICELQGLPAWLDVAMRFPDDTGITVTNATFSQPARVAPWKERSVLPADATLDALLRESERLRATRTPVVIEPAAFPREFSECYARESEWRALTGPDRDEVIRVAASTSRRVNERDIASAMESERSWCLQVLTTSARRRLLATSGLDAATWDRVRQDAVVVTDRHQPNEIIGQLAPIIRDPKSAPEEGEPPADAFSCLAWHNARPGARHFRVAARIDQPLRAELWVIET